MNSVYSRVCHEVGEFQKKKFSNPQTVVTIVILCAKVKNAHCLTTRYGFLIVPSFVRLSSHHYLLTTPSFGLRSPHHCSLTASSFTHRTTVLLQLSVATSSPLLHSKSLDHVGGKSGGWYASFRIKGTRANILYYL